MQPKSLVIDDCLLSVSIYWNVSFPFSGLSPCHDDRLDEEKISGHHRNPFVAPPRNKTFDIHRTPLTHVIPLGCEVSM